ncbi:MULTISPECIES: hypothetical protein [Bacillus cereus group]|uniref:Uncharacterized protein n=4 Tax=Bacteria TaxID=2 RepID=A0A0J1HXN2_BACAN|nr:MULTISPECIES: hypothetical protein [Bacillus cereus group]EOQ19800.1 hypothetical protein IKC_04274 [Bacillus cereus VD184]KLV18448.1 hypothetical protein ABW01_13835 [Bacillus anthracis]MBF8119047.1 hypothetical protein [Bacillus cereus]OUB76869.1 hypothetical protein BK750_03070 [Bacillus thuringiensis serovar jegathesan]
MQHFNFNSELFLKKIKKYSNKLRPIKHTTGELEILQSLLNQEDIQDIDFTKIEPNDFDSISYIFEEYVPINYEEPEDYIEMFGENELITPDMDEQEILSIVNQGNSIFELDNLFYKVSLLLEPSIPKSYQIRDDEEIFI